MIYAFEDFELDTARAELRRSGEQVPVEPQVFDLLLFLVQKPDIVISRDELVATIWQNRIVSEAAIASCIKSARKAIGDAGKDQRFIKTVRGRGIRFMAAVRTTEPSPTVKETVNTVPDLQPVETPPVRPSIAVLPFSSVGALEKFPGLSEAIPHDLILELSRLRWLFVIARGSSFRYRGNDVDIREIGAGLNVSYVFTGTVEIAGPELIISVELAETQSGGIIWADRRHTKLDLIHVLRGDIASDIVSALEIQITANEANQAQLKSPENLDAWSAYHLGLRHMYRFTNKDNARAADYFNQAVLLDPHFARAYAGLSFTHFQNAFVKYSRDPAAETAQARKYAELALEQDALDPFANYNMGRSCWLEGSLEASQNWLERATDLNPNYAQGIYCRGLTNTLLGESESGQKFVDEAMALSPLDPLFYAMSATRALSHILRSEYSEAVEWAKKGVRSPGAHVHIEIITMVAHHLNGDQEKALELAAKIRAQNKSVTASDFLRAFPFRDDQVSIMIRDTLASYGF